jgi:hypothetical protein
VTTEVTGEIMVASAVRTQWNQRFWDPNPWHVEFPALWYGRVAELKDLYLRSGFHGSDGLVGFRFRDAWPILGQKFTYDARTRTWDL